MKKDNILIVMPAYNEEKKIGQVIDKLKSIGYNNIVVVDDASIDKTGYVARSKDIKVLRHPFNRGLGGALSTGLEYAKITEAEVAVTFDSDGQHDPSDVEKLVKPIINNRCDVVIGSRLLDSKGMPLIRKVGNYGLNVITYVLFGVWTTDSQSGLRAFSKNAIKKIQIKTNRMEVSSEFFTEIKRNNLSFKEVPIKAIYSDYSLNKGQSHLNAINIVIKLIFKRLMR